ncbi:amino acid permease-domain-containing protein [Gamsiella multidivaricata]|uniref:amino acid permease-domain-containing protein n=1 Tax=Gamsiella multidivaricata TaxID=101098 RepID=UPI00221F1947|nr:amino acid permease-domain-containing protein [Gamsiella multidivaricata]KAI7820298.1 amino acid permease-domain-containing protein [Gamsiella multidivaricata]
MGDGTRHLRRDNESFIKWQARRLTNTRTFASLDHESETSQMKRVLTVKDLSAMGIGAIIGTGIFVLTGVVAHERAGPGVAISFVIAAIVAGLAALSYAEMACLVPIAGSAYTYTYATCGELLAWIIGWDLILEYLVGAATVSVGFSHYLEAFFKDAFGWEPQTKLMRAPFAYQQDAFSLTGDWFSLPSFLIVILLTILLCRGVKSSARVNNILVVVKLIVIVVFIFGACKWVDPANFSPFVPPNTGKFGEFGPSGILRGATIVFFAFIGFDAISTAAQEARNPQRDLPIGIGLSLVICTVLYIATSIVMLGVVNYTEIAGTGRGAPFQVTAAATGMKWLSIFCEIGILAGLISVMLVLLIGQPRIFFSMAVDGLFPEIASRLHPKYKTPVMTTAIAGVVCAAAGGMFPVDLLADLTSVGTLFAFFLVHCSVLILRWREPDRPRRFKVPLGPVLPVLGAACCVGLIAVDSVSAIIRLVVWLAIGLVFYAAYGSRHSRLNNPERYALSEPMEVVGERHHTTHEEVKGDASPLHTSTPNDVKV